MPKLAVTRVCVARRSPLGMQPHVTARACRHLFCGERASGARLRRRLAQGRAAPRWRPHQSSLPRTAPTPHGTSLTPSRGSASDLSGLAQPAASSSTAVVLVCCWAGAGVATGTVTVSSARPSDAAAVFNGGEDDCERATLPDAVAALPGGRASHAGNSDGCCRRCDRCCTALLPPSAVSAAPCATDFTATAWPEEGVVLAQSASVPGRWCVVSRDVALRRVGVEAAAGAAAAAAAVGFRSPLSSRRSRRPTRGTVEVVVVGVDDAAAAAASVAAVLLMRRPPRRPSTKTVGRCCCWCGRGCAGATGGGGGRGGGANETVWRATESAAGVGAAAGPSRSRRCVPSLIPDGGDVGGWGRVAAPSPSPSLSSPWPAAVVAEALARAAATTGVAEVAAAAEDATAAAPSSSPPLSSSSSSLLSCQSSAACSSSVPSARCGSGDSVRPCRACTGSSSASLSSDGSVDDRVAVVVSVVVDGGRRGCCCSLAAAAAVLSASRRPRPRTNRASPQAKRRRGVDAASRPC